MMAEARAHRKHVLLALRRLRAHVISKTVESEHVMRLLLRGGGRGRARGRHRRGAQIGRVERAEVGEVYA